MSDDLALILDGKSLQGWSRVRVTRGIERFPSDFDLGLMDKYPGSEGKQLVKPGMPCQVKIGDDLVITGYVDSWEPSIDARRHEIRTCGRSKCEDLVDCSAEWENNVISNANALQIAQRLAKPYGISVSSSITSLDTVPQFTLNWGESPQEIIERICRWAALLYYDKPDGSLYLTRVGTKKAASGVAEGVNVERAYYRSSMDERFSNYVGVAMSITPIMGNYNAITRSTATDPDVAAMRYRKRINIVESTMNTPALAKRAIDWEANRRYGRSKQLYVRIDSWRDTDGKLWEPNTLIPVNMPTFGLENLVWLCGEVTYLKDEEGTHAELVLMPKEAFAVQPYSFYTNNPILNS